jgi:Asp-tRNA(Asn)/Glu-tRNA(Gln) amidotransferase A subunit family amidase
MAAMVRERRISPVELVDAHLRRIAKYNPRVNAFVVLLEEQAREAGKQAEAAVMRDDAVGLLHGVPVTVKDSFDMAGLPTLCGSKLRLGHRAAEDATSVGRLRAAGAIILGKTNCPEFLSNYETDNYITGRTNNPWNLDYTAGGSSGGESAAISSYCSAGGIGSDGGGSIRIPAHFCGIVGLKPTPGRVSAAGHYPVISHPGGLMGVAGPMARTVNDVRLLFAALVGYDSQDPFSAPVPLRAAPIGGLRIGLMEQFSDVPVQPEMRGTVHKAARALEQIGYKVEPFRPRGIERAPNLWWFFFGQLPAPLTKQLIQGREQDAHWTSTEFLTAALEQPAPTVEDVLSNLAIRDRMRGGLLREMENVPLVLMPACGVSAFKHRERHWSTGAKTIGLFEAMMPVTPWNLLGMPAIVVPFGQSEQGLPIGVQLVGRPWEEELILEVAARLEEARGPFPAPPDFSS